MGCSARVVTQSICHHSQERHPGLKSGVSRGFLASGLLQPIASAGLAPECSTGSLASPCWYPRNCIVVNSSPLGQRTLRGAILSLSPFPTRTNPSPQNPISPYPGPSVTLWSWFTLVTLLLVGLENSMSSPSLNTTTPWRMDECDLSPSILS